MQFFNLLALPDIVFFVLWSIIVCVGGLLLIGIVVYFLPVDYFTRTDFTPIFRQRAWLRWAANILGSVLILLGFFLLLVPGPGALTLLIGISLIQTRKKHEILARLGTQAGIRNGINSMRLRMGRAPMQFIEGET